MGKGGVDSRGLIFVLVVVTWLGIVGYFSVAVTRGAEDRFADWDAVPCYVTKVEADDGFCRVRARVPSLDCIYYMVDPPNVMYDEDGVVIGEEEYDGTASCHQHYQDLIDRDGFAFNTTCFSDPEAPGDQNCEVAISRTNSRSTMQWTLLVLTGIVSACGFLTLVVMLCYSVAVVGTVCRDACRCGTCHKNNDHRTCGRCLGTSSHLATAGAPTSGGAVKVTQRDPRRSLDDATETRDGESGRSMKGKGKGKGKSSKRKGKDKPDRASSSSTTASASDEDSLAEATSTVSSVLSSAFT